MTSSAPVYDMVSVNIPRLSGRSLAMFVRLVESSQTRWAMLGQLLKSGGINKLRSLELDEAPTYLPIHPAATRAQRANLPAEELSSFLTTLRLPQKGMHFPTVRDYYDAYRTGASTPEEVAERALAAIEASAGRKAGGAEAPGMNIFIAWSRDDLMSQARESAQRWKEGRPLSPLDGVPVAVKDEVDMIPFPTTVGTSFLGRSPVQRDSAVVARMRAAGALLLGKTNMHEIGIGVTGLNPHHGVARNPYHPGHHTGGSSSGPAAAVAAGICPIAIGADAGGSIRIPSSFCGVVGLKPTYGRVSEFGAYPLCWSVAHLGPIAATALDAALGYAVMAGPDPHDPNSLHQPEVTLKGIDKMDLNGLKLGVFWPWFQHAAPEVVAACEQMLRDCENLGAQVCDIQIPELDVARVAHVATITSEMAASFENIYHSSCRDFSLEVRLNLALARSFTARDYLQAQRVRTRANANLERIFKGVDAIFTPATAITAPPIRPDSLPDGDSDISLLTEIMRFATLANLTGYPAISFPAGYDSQGLPIGMQAIGRPWEEHLLLRLARVAEELVERQAPKVFYQVFADGAMSGI